jgi:hypothetical protein
MIADADLGRATDLRRRAATSAERRDALEAARRRLGKA